MSTHSVDDNLSPVNSASRRARRRARRRAWAVHRAWAAGQFRNIPDPEKIGSNRSSLSFWERLDTEYWSAADESVLNEDWSTDNPLVSGLSELVSRSRSRFDALGDNWSAAALDDDDSLSASYWQHNSEYVRVWSASAGRWSWVLDDGSTVASPAARRAALLRPGYGPLGLSSAHIFSRGFRSQVPAYVTTQGGVVTLRHSRYLFEQGSSSGGGTRGAVLEFTPASRRRLMRTVATTKGSILPDFATLTYPASYADNWREWKRDLNVLWLRLRRVCPGASWVWKLEPQKRGAPHFHLLVWGVSAVDAAGQDTNTVPAADWLLSALHAVDWFAYEDLLSGSQSRTAEKLRRGLDVTHYEAFRLWLAVNWYQVVGSLDSKHLQAGVQYDRVRSYHGVVAYAAKYLGKCGDLPDEWRGGVGRYWGVYGRSSFPAQPVITQIVLDGVITQMLRYARRFSRFLGKSWSPRSLTFLGDGEQWRRLLHYEAEQSSDGLEGDSLAIMAVDGLGGQSRIKKEE